MIVLSENHIDNKCLPDGATIRAVSLKTISEFSGNTEVEMIVCSRETAKAAAAIDLPKLKLLQLTSAGFDGVPTDEFAKKGVLVANAGDTYSVPIAETVMHGILMILKRFNKSPKNPHLRLRRNYKYITELKGKKAMILGAGSIGTEIAKRLSTFDTEIFGYDKFVTEKEPYKAIYGSREALKTALPDMDIVISTLPDNEETKRTIGGEIFGCFKNNSIFINVGRRAVINEDDLYRALKNGQVGFAVLDRFEILPNPVTDKFRRLRNVIVLPGVAAISQESKWRLQEYICGNISALLNGTQPKFVINRGK
jgi:phosphoglycerate dehydrogenase-like enzyme